MIRKIRREKKITQSELAKMLGVERSAVAKWESGVAKPRANMLLKLAGILGCTVDEILRDECDEEKQETPA